MTYLTIEQILFLHARLIEETGGTHGVHDVALLEAAIGRPQTTFDGNSLYPDLFSKAAALMESLAKNHPFVDGNKRTAITAAALFLRRNGYRLTVTNEELEHFTTRVATEQLGVESIAGWFQKQAEQILRSG